MTHQRDAATSKLRPLLPVPALAVAIILFTWIGGVTAFKGAKGGAAQDVEIAVAFDRQVPLPTVRLIQVYRSGFSEEVFPDTWGETIAGRIADSAWWKTPSVGREFRWAVSQRWARDFVIEIAEASVPFFRQGYVRIGGATYPLRVGILQELPVAANSPLPSRAPPVAKTVRASSLVERPGSFLPWFDVLLNYPGDLGFASWWLRKWLSHPFTLVTAIWLAATSFFASSPRLSPWRGKRLLKGFTPWSGKRLPTGVSPWRRERLLKSLGGSCRLSLGPDARIDPARNCSWAFFSAGLGLMVAAAVYLEWREPRYFLRDDNFSIFFPSISSVGRAIAAGQFPAWTPRIFLGMPIAELGVFAATYPPSWISYALANFLLGDPAWTVDVFCWGHLACGYGACFYVLRRDGLHPSVAAAAGMSWALCGFALIAGRSWYYMTPVFAYLPLIAGMLHNLLKGRRKELPQRAFLARTWAWQWGVVWGLFFHAGNAQMWLYAIQLFTLWVLWAGYRGRLGAAAVFRL
ncbi:MAG: hypothetical protein GYA33_01265, partial [Thermogutta sp.]|nr:hypothetical protein [Thermogutta sp.]